MTTDRHSWYAVSLSNGVPTGTSSGTYLFGEEIVVWRDGNAAPHVWVDRCPHRDATDTTQRHPGVAS